MEPWLIAILVILGIIIVWGLIKKLVKLALIVLAFAFLILGIRYFLAGGGLVAPPRRAS